MTTPDVDQRSRDDNLPLAIGTILFSVLALSLGDALIKLTSSNFAIWQIFVLRSLIAIPVLLAIRQLPRMGVPLRPVHGFWTIVRSLLLVVMWVIYYSALPHLQLPVAAAAYYTLPFFITLFSALLLGDKISRLGWIAVAIGFVGILLILRPNAGDFNAYALLPLISAMLYALAMILTRSKCQGESPLVLAIALNLSFVVVGGIMSLTLSVTPNLANDGFLLGRWSTMEGTAWIAMAILAISILIGSLGAAISYQKGPPAIVGIFDFAYVGFAVIWGIVIFGEVPSISALGGIALITLAGALSVKR